ncbi:12426_t:CDS:1 [Cetraspora pellucida]|uniref:12426_t:CDS:1 n=1 Tax=Cetraspora pellucida TaxID=1433469 RepID=A0ACA9MEQ9_9GLOM|nr:12426_t:CDS:1 [Cetraspora pellucida]
MPENTKEQITSSQSLSKGKKKVLDNVASSTSDFLHTIIPMDGKSATANLSTLMNNITTQKPGTSSTLATSFLQEEWVTGQIYEDKQPKKFAISQSVNPDFNDAKWENWINSSEYSDYDNFFEMSKHKYPFHHHFHEQDSLDNSYQKDDGNEIIDFLNSSIYTDEVYVSNFKDEDHIPSSSFNKYGSELDDFLETPDILSYLAQIRYTDDVYGMPVFLKKLVNEAKDEIFNEQEEVNESYRKTAIKRLEMVREHLIKKKEQSTDNEMRELLDNLTQKTWNVFGVIK